MADKMINTKVIGFNKFHVIAKINALFLRANIDQFGNTLNTLQLKCRDYNYLIFLFAL